MTPATPLQYDGPRGTELVRIRTELVEHCRAHCGPFVVAMAEESLAKAVAALPRPMVQVELFQGVA